MDVLVEIPLQMWVAALLSLIIREWEPLTNVLRILLISGAVLAGYAAVVWLLIHVAVLIGRGIRRFWMWTRDTHG